MLLAEPIKRSVQDPDLYDTPIPAYKRESSMGNVLVWVIWLRRPGVPRDRPEASSPPRTRSRRRCPLIGNLASLAVLYLLASGSSSPPRRSSSTPAP